jgi:vacuolar-type H+-ATPase subunit I/STV1
MNTTNLTMELYKYSTYSQGCIDDVNKALSYCETFKVHVINNMSNRFLYGVIALIIFVILSFIFRYVIYKYSSMTWYIFILKRIDWILIVLSLTLIAMMFI